ncbi:MAG: HU family DNA-binding protein [Planctomycetota bacterium]|nr:MAG: HU family DNA-binding protein [Planctomycetota bacterium]
MNKEELVALIAKRHSNLFRSKAAALRALDAVLDGITAGLKRDSRNGVNLVDFGRFRVKSMRKRKGVDPRNQQPIIVPARRTVKFKCGKGLRESVERKPRKQKPQTKDEKRMKYEG